MYFLPLQYQKLKIHSGYQHEIPGQPLRNALFKNNIYPVRVKLQKLTDEEKKTLQRKCPGRDFPYPLQVIEVLDNDKMIEDSFYDLEKQQLKGIWYLGTAAKVRNKSKNGVRLNIPEKVIVAPLNLNLFNLTGSTPYNWHIAQAAGYIPTEKFQSLRHLLPKIKGTSNPDFYAFALQILETHTEHILQRYSRREDYRRHNLLPQREEGFYPLVPTEISDEDKKALWANIVPRFALAIADPGRALTFIETKQPFATRREKGKIGDAKITYNLSFIIPPVEGSDEMQGGMLHIPVAQYFVRLPFIWSEKENDFENLDPILVEAQAGTLRKLLLEPDYPNLIYCLFDVFEKKDSESPTKTNRTWQETLEKDRQLWHGRYDAIGKSFFFPDWVLRLLQKHPTIPHEYDLPTEEQTARANSTDLRDSFFFRGFDQSDERKLTPNEKLIGLALLFGILDPERPLIMNTAVFKPKKRVGPIRKAFKGLRQGQKKVLEQRGCGEVGLIKDVEITQTLDDLLTENVFEEWNRLATPGMLGQSEWTIQEDVQQL